MVGYAYFIRAHVKFDFAMSKFSKSYLSAVHTTPPEQAVSNFKTLKSIFNKLQRCTLQFVPRLVWTGAYEDGWFKRLNTIILCRVILFTSQLY